MWRSNCIHRARIGFIMAGTLLLVGCSALTVVSYPEPRQLPGGVKSTEKVQLTEHEWFGENYRELAQSISFHHSGLDIAVSANSRSEKGILIGPLVFPIIPIFWLPAVGDKTLKLNVSVSGQNFSADPAQFVVVQNGKELRPNTSRTNVKTDSHSSFNLEYGTDDWEFVLKLHGISNLSGLVELPDVIFSRGAFWLLHSAP